MIRQTLYTAAKPALRSSLISQQRTFAVSAFRMGEGDTGATRSGGAASSYVSNSTKHAKLTGINSDAFNKREKANEDYAIKARERQK
jgi:ATPase inhibitor, mitochondrial